MANVHSEFDTGSVRALESWPVAPCPMAGRVVAFAPRAMPRAGCATCCVREICLAGGLEGAELERFSELALAARRVERGAALYHHGERFTALYAVRSGAFKTVGLSRAGEEKVTGFHLPGELLGLDAIASGRHDYRAVALEDSEVCVLPFPALERLARTVPALQHRLLRAISGEISRDGGLMLLLGGMSAEQRLAAFLLSLSRRYERMGYDPRRFVLRMTRQEIGNYLGLTLETVSRIFSRFHREGVIAVEQREVELRDPQALCAIVGR
jgi:CRP/FNR family transcriptional regulator